MLRPRDVDVVFTGPLTGHVNLSTSIPFSGFVMLSHPPPPPHLLQNEEVGQTRGSRPQCLHELDKAAFRVMGCETGES